MKWFILIIIIIFLFVAFSCWCLVLMAGKSDKAWEKYKDDKWNNDET